MELSLSGRRAVVCGSTRGIGRAVAMQLAGQGASLLLLARDEGRLRETVDALPRSAEATHQWAVADFADPDQVRDAISRWLERVGSGHVLVNNTGGPPPGRAIDATAEQYLAAFRAHLIGAQLLVQALVPGMRAARFGRIINIISTSVKAPIPNLGVSNTIRAAVANWAKTLAGELAADGITVNNVLPGFTETERLAELFAARAQREGTTVERVRHEAVASIPAGRLGRPEEIAAAVGFLASPAASYINGINLPVDGGRTQSL